MKEEYNWWTDPKNAEEVKRISWWDWPESKYSFPFPLAVISEDTSDGKVWVVTGTSETEKLIGKISGSAQGDTREEAIEKYFKLIKWQYEYLIEKRLDYERWVPLIIGPWKHTGGKWLSIFGIDIYFRYGKNMKYGWYIPFTKLNISIHSQWKTYRNWIKNKKNDEE